MSNKVCYPASTIWLCKRAHWHVTRLPWLRGGIYNPALLKLGCAFEKVRCMSKDQNGENSVLFELLFGQNKKHYLHREISRRDSWVCDLQSRSLYIISTSHALTVIWSRLRSILWSAEEASGIVFLSFSWIIIGIEGTAWNQVFYFFFHFSHLKFLQCPSFF